MNFVHSIRSYSNTIAAQLFALLFLVFLSISSVDLYGQCETVSTRFWSNPDIDLLTADIDGVSVQIETINLGLSGIEEIVTSTTMTTTDPSWFSEAVAGNPTVEFLMVWDFFSSSNEQTTDIDTPFDNKQTGILEFTFSEPVSCVTLHVEKLGGAGADFGSPVGISNSSRWTLLTPGITLQKPPGTGTNDLIVTPTEFFKEPDIPNTSTNPEATQGVTTGSAAGSIKLISSAPITQFAFEWTGTGVEGLGADRIELAITAQPDCFPVAQINKFVDDVRILPNGTFEVDYAYQIENSGQTSINEIKLIEDLKANLGCAFLALNGVPTVSLTNNTGTSVLPTQNINFDGDNDPNIFNGTDGVLISGDFIYVNVSTTLDPHCSGVNSPLTNEVFLSGFDQAGQQIVGSDSEDLFLPRMTISKTADISGFSDPVTPGDPIIYNFEICNTGNGVISSIQVSDELEDLVLFSFPFSLSPGECNSTNVSGLYNITTQDLVAGGVTNQATVNGLLEDGTLVTDLSDDPNDDTNVDPDLDGDPDDPTVVILDPVPLISIIKTANISNVQNPTMIGDEILYLFEICNTGSVALSNIMIDDPLLTLSGSPFTLMPGTCNSSSISGSYLINQQDIDAGEILNTAVVTGESPFGEIVSDESEVKIILNMAPQVELTKIADASTIQNPTAPGDIINYSFEICNVGNVLLNNVVLSDPLLNLTPIPISLSIGECDNISFSGSYSISVADIINGVVINSASVSASGTNGIFIIDVSDDSRRELDGDDDPTIVELFPCELSIGQLQGLENRCKTEFQTINLTTSFLENPVKPSDFEILYVLTEGDNLTIIDSNSSPNFSVTTAGDYRIHTLIAETSDPQSSNYLNPSIIVLGVTKASEIIDLISTSGLCAIFDEIGVNSLVSEQAVVELVNRVTICNSDELLMPTSIIFSELFTSGFVEGIWSEDSIGIITSESLDFTNFTAGEYVLDFVSTSAIEPCVNVSASAIVTVVDCFSECDELICNENLQISLGDDCILVPSPDQLLESPATGVYTIEYFYENDRPYGIDTIRSDAAGELLTFNISCAGNSCWGKISVELNNLPQLESPCPCNDSEVPRPNCILWCQDEDQLASLLISVEEAERRFGECGPQILGNIDVNTRVTGDICDPNGEKHVVTYSAKLNRHGTIKLEDILCQTYWVQKFDIDLSDSEFNASFGFPGNVILDCDYLDDLEDVDSTLIQGSPESILLSQDHDSLAYPYYINTHAYVQDSIYEFDTQLVLIDSFLVDTLILNERNEWEVFTIAIKEYDTLFSRQLVPNGLAIHPLTSIKERKCNLLVNFSDVQFEICGSGTKIVRSWNIVDWCDANIEKSGIQTIELRDVSSPQILQKQGDEYVEITSLPEVQIGVDPWACSASFKLPELDTYDNCDQDITTVWSTFEGKIVDNFASELWFEFSPVELTAYVYDDCDNVTEVSLMVNIIDDVPPVALAETDLLVTLAYGNPGFDQGEAKIYASDIDEGSHDGCSEVSFKAVKAIDWEEPVLNCKGEFAGYQPRTNSAITELVDLGSENEKNECVFDSTNMATLVTELQDFVNFDCDDNGLDFEVLFFAIDKAGNQNQASTNVRVTDESKPYLECQDIEFSCSDLEEDGEFEFEEPDILGSACFNFFLRADVASERRIEGACGSAQIIVEWYLDLDQSGDPTFGDAFCTQNVQIETDGEVLRPETIKWPQHYTGEMFEGINIECDSFGISRESDQMVEMKEPLVCVPGIVETEGPVWCDSDCGVVGTSVEIDTLFTRDECMKIVRKWTVIDWCVFNPNENGESDDGNDRFVAVEDWAKDECSTCFEFGPYNSDNIYFRYQEREDESLFSGRYAVDPDGYYTFDQVIKVIDDTPPTISTPDSIFVSIDISGVEQDAFGLCFGSGIVSASAIDFCGGEEIQSPLNWSAVVLDDDGMLVTDAISFDSILGQFVQTGVGSPGDSRMIIWNVSDGCGNSKKDTTIALFKDQTPPVPICPSSFTTSLSDIDSSIVFWAADLNQASYDNCSSATDLRFSIVFDGDIPNAPHAEDFLDNESIVFDCEYSGSVIDLNLWVWDVSGNGDFCDISVLIEASEEQCGAEPIEGLGYFISGQVITEDQRPIHNVEFKTSTSLPEYPRITKSDTNGNYAFKNNPEGFNYSIEGNKDDSFINGLSTLDLILLQRHIIALDPISSPYKILAGDANSDQQLTAADILDLRQLILGVTDELPNSKPWIFIDQSSRFFDTNSPWPYTESVTISDLSTDMPNTHFIGIKVGDLNQNVETSLNVNSETRENPELEIQIKNARVLTGDKLTIALSNSEFSHILGLQLTMTHQGLTYRGIRSGRLLAEENNVAAFDKQLTISVNEYISFDTSLPLLYLDFEVNRSLELKDIIHINNDITRSEVYVGDNISVFDLILSIEDENSDIILGQNIPNPFSTDTYIPFTIYSDSNVEFNFYDVFGRVVYNVNGKWTKGYHQLKVKKDDFNTSGLIFYEMKVGNRSQTGRMTTLE